MAEIGVIFIRIRHRQKCEKHRRHKKKSLNSKLKKFAMGLLGIAVVSGSVLSITLISLNVNFNTENITNVHNHVIDTFHTSHTIDEFGNGHYTVHPSRFGSLRDINVAVLPYQATIVTFMSDSAYGIGNR